MGEIIIGDVFTDYTAIYVVTCINKDSVEVDKFQYNKSDTVHVSKRDIYKMKFVTNLFTL